MKAGMSCYGFASSGKAGNVSPDFTRRRLLNARRTDLRSERNYAILALLVGCGLRRGELLSLRMRSVQLRQDHWVVADLHSKAGHIRTVPIPAWVKKGIDGLKRV